MTENSQKPRVYAVVPVFNRLDDTLTCLECLKGQTYPSIDVIVSDGGSNDGTPDVVARAMPDVVVLRSEKQLWWAGSAAVAVEVALERSTSADDFVLFLNNDTEFDSDYVARLVEASCRHEAAVSGIIIDRDAPDRILEAGVVLDPERFTFRQQVVVPTTASFSDRTDVLPAYGLLVPIRMLRAVGNLNARRYPHYMSDYDLTMRLRRAGFRIGVTYETSIRASATDLTLPGGIVSVRRVLTAALHRKSKMNIKDRLRFIDDHAPRNARWSLRYALLKRITGLLVLSKAEIDSLANAYRHGDGVPIGRGRALLYYRLAAALGHSNAMNNIGTMYLRGEGVPQDYVRAVKWFMKATGRGNPYAPSNLADMYRSGRGVMVDAERAELYSTLAAERGFRPDA